MEIKKHIRDFLWKILGISHSHINKEADHVFLKEDRHTRVGKHSYDNNAMVYRWCDAPLIIGRYCSISYDVKFILDDGKHGFNQVCNYPFRSNKIGAKRGITIGNDVWIGMNAIILNGITIGNGVIIAAGSIVTSDVPDYCVVAGVPAKVVKRKCSEEEANKMSEIAWWDWEDSFLEERLSDFKLSFPAFIRKYGE